MVTLHTIVCNESRFIKSALIAALSSNEVDRALVWDTGSTDRTVAEILSIKDKRIEFQQKGKMSRGDLVKLRNNQIWLTKTSWIILIDGDEIWPEKNLGILINEMKNAEENTIALVNKTRNAIGDLYHYLPESEGHYQIGQWKGHLNIRAIRNLPRLTVKGVYPNEWYELNGNKLQNQPEKLKFVDTWYLHTTHLRRSDNWLSEIKTVDRIKKHKWFYGLKNKKFLEMEKDEIPESLRTGFFFGE